MAVVIQKDGVTGEKHNRSIESEFCVFLVFVFETESRSVAQAGVQ